MGDAFKSALPQRRYCVLFPHRLDYYVNVQAREGGRERRGGATTLVCVSLALRPSST